MIASLHWEQRIALVRHNLHSASRSGDFGFFKSLQAQGFLAGINHTANLSATLGDDSDAVLSGLDDLNASLAYVHQDAFNNVYTSLKAHFADPDSTAGKSKVYVDATMQKQMAHHAIDKMTSSAIALIQQQPESIHDTATHVWITGNTIIADCMEICFKQIDMLENNMDDFIRLEDSWETVKASVGCSVSALKGIFNLMAVEDSNDVRQTSSPSTAPFAIGGGSMFRRLSNAFSGATGGSAPSSRHSSLSVASGPSKRNSDSLVPEYRTPNYLRNSVSNAMPTSLPLSTNPFQHSHSPFHHTRLQTIPPTPAAFEDDINPFDTSVPLPPAPQIPELRVSQAVMVLM